LYSSTLLYIIISSSIKTKSTELGFHFAIIWKVLADHSILRKAGLEADLLPFSIFILEKTSEYPSVNPSRPSQLNLDFISLSFEIFKNLGRPFIIEESWSWSWSSSIFYLHFGENLGIPKR
jgi:hypothetical protein